jgi:predicted dehydrogenase
MKTTSVGIIGCGNISAIYFKNAQTFENLHLAACADLVPEKARQRAQEFGVPRACTVAELLADPSIEIVINLTIPKAHAEVDIAALEAGKHVHAEKPLAITRPDGQRILDLARRKGLRVGSAPDTFLGGGLQTCRKLIDDGWIGRPVAATAFMMCRGHENWHPDPEFYYETGGGPMLDMGPYYLTALVSLLGPVRRVTGMTQVSFAERMITSKPKFGKHIKVEIPTHVTGLMDFACGAVGTIITSFDVRSAELPRIEIYGSEGTLSVPDPNGFGGPVRVRRAGMNEWQEVPLLFGYAENSRGIGVADMAAAISGNRPHRASGDLAFHVLDIMVALHEASAQGRHIALGSTCERPAPLPLDLRPGTLD